LHTGKKRSSPGPDFQGAREEGIPILVGGVEIIGNVLGYDVIKGGGLRKF